MKKPRAYRIAELVPSGFQIQFQMSNGDWIAHSKDGHYFGSLDEARKIRDQLHAHEEWVSVVDE